MSHRPAIKRILVSTLQKKFCFSGHKPTARTFISHTLKIIETKPKEICTVFIKTKAFNRIAPRFGKQAIAINSVFAFVM